MSNPMLGPLWEVGAYDLSVVAGVPKEFDLRSLLKNATAIRIAMAFGHVSGWNKIEEHLISSSAKTVQILLGQAFFQTEPQLLLKIKALQGSSKSPKFELRLASARATFHPKVWVIDHGGGSTALVGSGNLSAGGLLTNVECGLFSSQQSEVDALRFWFDKHWAAAPDLAKTLDDYIVKHQKISAARKSVDAQIAAATNEQIDKEATWRHRMAITKAAGYWRSDEGIAEVRQRETAIEKMRILLHFPIWDFNAQEFSEFLRIPELGRIRLGHQNRILGGLAGLKAKLKALTDKSLTLANKLEGLQESPGIGRNLATKLLAVYDPDKFIVVNGPVESALRAFNYEMPMDSHINGKSYGAFLKQLSEFIQECESQNLQAASALDAFFFEYQNFEV
jgi:HKD family nuclease